MKLSNTMVTQTLDQYDAKVIPETAPAALELCKRFGDHTFFVDNLGLNIIEPAEAGERSRPVGVVVNLATWNPSQTELSVHSPEPTDIVVEFSATDGSDAAG